MDNNSSKKQRFAAKAEETPAAPPGFSMPFDSCTVLPADTVAKIPELISKLTQECLESKKNLKSIEDVLEVETEERKKWENLQKKTEKEMSLMKTEFEKKLDEKQKYVGVLEERLNAMKNREDKIDLTFNKKLKELKEPVQSWQKQSNEMLHEARDALSKVQYLLKEMSLMKINLEKKLDDKQKYVGVLEERINAMNRENKIDSTFEKKFKELNDQVQSWLLKAMENDSDSKKRNMELIDQVHALETLNTTLIVKERESNDLLHEARTTLLKGMCDLKNQANVDIGIKMMGELDADIFDKQKKYEKGVSTTKYDIEAVEWCTLWQKRLNNPEWYPFRVNVDEAGNSTESLDDEDSMLQKLKENCGEEAYDRVTSTLKELLEYNPSGRTPVPEFWNFEKDRKAPMEEVIRHIFTQMKPPPVKRRRSMK